MSSEESRDRLPHVGEPVRERFGDDLPEMYCPACARQFGLKVPAVFARRPDSDHYSVICPVAGLDTHDSGYISHSGPLGQALGEDGYRYLMRPDGPVRIGATTWANGSRTSILSRLMQKWGQKWAIWTAEKPRMGSATRAPETALVVEDFDWGCLDEENRLKGELR